MARGVKGTTFDLEVIEKLAMIHCTNTEIAAVLNCDSSLLSKGIYSEVIAKGKEKGKLTLRRKMFESAMNGNVTLMIWLSKNILGYTDRELVKHTTEADGSGFKITVEDYTHERKPKDIITTQTTLIQKDDY